MSRKIVVYLSVKDTIMSLFLVLLANVISVLTPFIPDHLPGDLKEWGNSWKSRFSVLHRNSSPLCKMRFDRA